MNERPRFFDDLAGVAGGAFSAFVGLRDEAEAMMRARCDEAIRKFDLVKREDLEAVQEMAANARAGQEAAEARVSAMEQRIATLETSLSGQAKSGATGPAATGPAATGPAATGPAATGMGGARGGIPGEPGPSAPTA